MLSQPCCEGKADRHMTRLALVWRDLRIVGRAIWINLSLFAAMLLGATILMEMSGSYPGISFDRILVKAFFMALLDPVEGGIGPIPTLLTFMLPILTMIILGEGAVRVLTVYLRRSERREEWDLLVAQTFSKHTVICGVGELGRAVIHRLMMHNPEAQVVLVDNRPDILAELGLSGPNICHLQSDMTAQATLEAARCQEASLIILTSGSDGYNLEAGSKALRLNPKAEIWIRLYRSGLASLMDLGTKPNVHFFSPYERAAEALVEHITARIRQHEK